MIEDYDMVVVGGGIAGLYCCTHSGNDKKVGLFEATHRIGGKIETVKMDVFDAEYGAMRFDPLKQPTMKELIQELGLELEHFYEYTSPPLKNIKTIYNLDESEKGLTSLQLFNLGLQRIFNKSEQELLSLTEEEIEYIKKEGKFKGKYLWEQGFWNVFGDVLSHDAIKYIIMEGSFYHFIHENPCTADWGTDWIKLFQMSKYLKGVKNGMHLITDTMLNRIKDKVQIHKKHILLEISRDDNDKIMLRFDNNKKENICRTKNAILAIPPRSLKTIKGLPEHIINLLDSVIEIPLIKCFFVVKDPWWNENIPNEGSIPFPTREIHYYKKDGKGNIMVYADRPYLAFWNQYINSSYHAETELNNNKELPLMFARRMNINPDNIITYGIRDWGKEPYGAACHMWRSGVKSWEISEIMEGFSLNGRIKNVYICGEAYSHFQGFMEGAVRTANNVMTKIVGNYRK